MLGRQAYRQRAAGVCALRAALLVGAAAAPLIAGTAFAQAPVAPADVVAETDEVVVTGLRGSLQSSIERKREATVVADVLSAEDIGDLPALSIGEAIETITGASTHREKGGASEIAIRGLGPFLGAASFNGREATNGSGDRSVNFNQFPSELINTVAVYKTQRADFIEGGVSGIINMETVQPLDFGRRRIQLEGRAIWADYDDKLKDPEGLGWRGTASYVDQFDLGGFGRLGISVGVQSLESTNPEEAYSGSSTWNACNNTLNSSSTATCSNVSREQVLAGTPFYLVPSSSRTYRQFVEDDQRDAYFMALQWRPNDAFEVALDYQNSRRTYFEERNDLNLAEVRRGLANREVGPDGRLLFATGNSYVEATPTYRTRDELYEGGGLRLGWDASERLTLSTDLSISQTYRSEFDRQVRLRAARRDIYGTAVPGTVGTNNANGDRVLYSFDARNGDLPTIDFGLFDVDDHDNFSAAARARRDEAVREDELRAIRFDGDYALDGGFLTSVQAGVRLAERIYSDFDDRVEINVSDTAAIRNANLACRTEFPQSDFLSNASGNTVTSFATFDARCLFRAITGAEDTGRNSDLRAIGNRDVTETVTAAYALAEFASEAFGVPVTGNIGLRYVNTKVESVGLRSGFDVVQNPDGTFRLQPTNQFESFTIEGETDAWLPSFNAAFEAREDFLVRVGLFRAMSRPDLSDLGAGRDFDVDNSGSFATVADAIERVTANGNPRAEALLSWNADLSFEWYPDRDTLFSAAAYYKLFNGGFVPVVIDETYVIDGQSVTIPVSQETATDEDSTIYGIELTAAYRFSRLPAPFDGIGAKLSYNWANSDFETQDISLGTVIDPATGAVTPGIVPPANIFGLSEHVFSGQLYWEVGPLELASIYKYRSEYYQKFVGGPSQLRYIRDTGVLDLRATYRVNRNLSLTLEGTNLTDEPRFQDMPIPGSVREYNTYGARYYLGARYRF